jgi:hypothetical protein
MHRLTRADFDRRFRRIDMMITGHSVLRDRRRAWARLLTLSILGLSIVGLALAFVADREVTVSGLSARFQVWVGSISAAIFFLALIDLQVDWKGTARSHAEAADRLAELKAKFAGAQVDDTSAESEVDLQQEYERTMAAIVPLPDRKFTRLKAKHLRKVEVSRILDTHPGTPVLVLQLIVLWRGLRPRDRSDSRSTPPEN